MTHYSIFNFPIINDLTPRVDVPWLDPKLESRVIADAKATARLAKTLCPEDVVRFGEAHRIARFAEMTWMNGFQAGWRAAHDSGEDDVNGR